MQLYNHFVLVGGFGISPDPRDPFRPSNPMDVWVSRDGGRWQQVSSAPWQARSPADVKYHFKALAVSGGRPGTQQMLTFGGDRETFNFADPSNWPGVDNDVWRLGWAHLPNR